MKIVLALLAASAGYYYLSTPSSSDTSGAPANESARDHAKSSVSSNLRTALVVGDRYTFDSHENKVEYSRVSDFEEEYRVFGVTAVSLENSPVNHVAAFVVALPLGEAEQIAARDGCERAAASSARMLPVILSSETAASVLENPAKRTRLRLKGGVMSVDKHLFKGAPLPPQSASADISKIYLVESAEPIEKSSTQHPARGLYASGAAGAGGVSDSASPSNVDSGSAPLGQDLFDSNRSWDFEKPSPQRSTAVRAPQGRPKGKTVIIRRCGR